VLPSFPKRGPLSLLVMVATALLSLAYVLARELISGSRPESRNRGRYPEMDEIDEFSREPPRPARRVV